MKFKTCYRKMSAQIRELVRRCNLHTRLLNEISINRLLGCHAEVLERVSDGAVRAGLVILRRLVSEVDVTTRLTLRDEAVPDAALPRTAERI